MIEVHCTADGDLIVLTIVGEICLVTVPVLSSCIDAAIEAEACHLVLDLRGVTLFGAAGADLVVEVSRTLTAMGGSLSIRGADGLTAYVLELTGLGRLLEPAQLAS